MNTDRTGAQLQSVHRQIVIPTPYGCRIGNQPLHVFLVWRSKRMVCRKPSLRLLVKFEHGEIRYPDRPEGDVSRYLPSKMPLRRLDNLVREGGNSMTIGIAAR